MIWMMGHSLASASLQRAPDSQERQTEQRDIQRDLERLEKWADGYLMKFSKEKCKVLQLSTEKPSIIHQDMLGSSI